jgi:hypothetical protein
MTDFRTLCAELVNELEDWIAFGDEVDCADAHAVVDRARAALTSPSLKEQALQVLEDVNLDSAHYNIIRRALEALDD